MNSWGEPPKPAPPEKASGQGARAGWPEGLRALVIAGIILVPLVLLLRLFFRLTDVLGHFLR